MHNRKIYFKIFGIMLILLSICFAILSYQLWIKETCTHEHWTNGVCDRCKVVCQHPHWNNGVCEVCGSSCSHLWNKLNGKCQICGATCKHDFDAYHICKICKFECTDHKYNENSQCVICGYVCKNHKFKDGICTICNYHCPHEWMNGVCNICDYHCPHEMHDKDTQICLSCGEKVPHHFIDGYCKCGAEPLAFAEWLPWEYYQECDQQGTITTYSYPTPYFNLDVEGTMNKRVNIYTPFGYDSSDTSKKYNVMVLIHGGGGQENSWMIDTIDYGGGYTVTMRNIYDHMIKNKIIEPLIIVAPSTFTCEGPRQDTGVEQISGELRNVIMPYIADNYNTYAKNGDEESLIAAREHFGIGGLSNGSLYAFNNMWTNFDIFANFLCMSGSNCSTKITEVINEGKYKDLPISYLFAGAGEGDGQLDRTWGGFYTIIKSSDRFQEGKNCMFRTSIGDHEWKVWSNLFFHGIQLMFP